MSEELFRSADLVVRLVDGHRSSACVVTFDSFTDFRTLDRPGFGQEFLIGVGLDAIHIISRDNDWYHYAEMADAMAAVHAATRRYDRVVTYGSSMGGYAAIRFAGLAGADAALALSPQYSIDPAAVPWERRWAQSAKRFDPRWEKTLPFPQLREAYVVYDPINRDRKHGALLAAKFKHEAIRIERAGHPVTGFLADLGLLQRSIVDVAHGRFDGTAFAREAMARCRESSQYLLTLADGLGAGRRRQRLELVRESARLSPHNPGIVSRFGLELSRAGLFEESLAQHRSALALAPGHPHMLLNQSVSVEHSGDIDGALAIMEQVEALTDGAVIYRPRLSFLRESIAARDAPSEPQSSPEPVATSSSEAPPKRPGGSWFNTLLRPRWPKPARPDGG